MDRSRTAEDLYRDDPRYDVLSAGLAPFAMTPMSRELMQWADRVFVMCEREEQHRTLLKMRFPDVDRPVIDLREAERLLCRLAADSLRRLTLDDFPRGA